MFCIVNSTFLPTESFNLSDFQGSCTSQWVTNLQDEVSDRQTEGGDLSSTSLVTEEKIRDHPKLDFQGSKRTVLKEIMVLGSLFCLSGGISQSLVDLWVLSYFFLRAPIPYKWHRTDQKLWKAFFPEISDPLHLHTLSLKYQERKDRGTFDPFALSTY